MSFSPRKSTIRRRLRPNDVESVNLLLRRPECVRTFDIKAPFVDKKPLVQIIDACRTLFPYTDCLDLADFSVESSDMDVPYPLPRLRDVSLSHSSGGGFRLKSLRWMFGNVPVRTFMELLQRNEGLESMTIWARVYFAA